MEAIVSWRSQDGAESAFALTHPAHAPREANERVEVRRLVWPNEYLTFVSARLGRRIAEPQPLRAIVWALAPFVMRHDNAAGMDGMPAASFGAIPGGKPGGEAQQRGPVQPPKRRGRAG